MVRSAKINDIGNIHFLCTPVPPGNSKPGKVNVGREVVAVDGEPPVVVEVEG